MAEKDREKWDKKFTQKPDLLASRPPSKFVERYHKLCEGKRALDLACGGGRHTLFLSKQGFFVDGVDISSVALDKLSPKVGENVTLIEADLDRYEPKKDYYDLIVMTNFLDHIKQQQI